MLKHSDIIVKDGNDEIIFSFNGNVYNDELYINNIEGFNFYFVFKTDELDKDQSDVFFSPEGGDLVKVTISNKARKVTGGGTKEKMQVVAFEDGSTLLVSIFARLFHDNVNILNVSITFYKRSA